MRRFSICRRDTIAEGDLGTVPEGILNRTILFFLNLSRAEAQCCDKRKKEKVSTCVFAELYFSNIYSGAWVALSRPFLKWRTTKKS